jgi:hypothetical protein
MIRAAERWQGLPVTAFERRRLEAVQGELDAEYQTRIGRRRPYPSPRFPALSCLDRSDVARQTAPALSAPRDHVSGRRVGCSVARKERQGGMP